MGDVKIEEIVVLSGKGGTGKTSVAASLAVLARDPVIADCDVDAADLHLVLSPVVEERHEFWAGREAVIRTGECIACGDCEARCRFGAVRRAGEPGMGGAEFSIDPLACEGCGVCVHFCPQEAIDFPERRCGEWMISSTRCGPMVHARLDAAAENSGKLVSLVRRVARRVATLNEKPLMIVDGPPGIGCPVIASLTGATFVLVVTEPTLSGSHDMKRVLDLARHFEIPAAVCVNKWDLNPDMAERIEKEARDRDALDAGRIRYDRGFTRAQMQEKAVVEMDSPAAQDIKGVWSRINRIRC